MAKKVKMTPVESSNIKSFHYGSIRKILRIEFHSGKTYEYYPVPSELVNGFINAESKGKFFHENFRNNPSINCNPLEL